MQTNAVANSKFQVARAVPFFVVENHPKFVEFMTHYYKWFNSQGAGAALESLKQQSDLDTADDVAQFFVSFGKGIPDETKSNKRWFIRFLKEFYSLKGTQASFDFFTRAVFGQPATVFYPKNQVLKSSGAQWNTQKTMCVYAVDGDTLWDLAGAKIEYPGFSFMVDEVYKKENYWILTLDYLVGEPVMLNVNYQFGDHICQVLPQYGIMSISGQGFQKGDLIVFPQVTIQITKSVTGGVKVIGVEAGGTNYAVGDKVEITNTIGKGCEAVVETVDNTGAIVGVKVIRHGNGFTLHDTQHYSISVTSDKGTDATLKITGWTDSIGDIVSAQIIRNTIWSETKMEVEAKTNADVKIVFEMRAVHEFQYGERASCSPSSLSSFLNDQDYYQNYSYEVRSSAELKDVESSLKELCHIAGMKMFVHSANEDVVALGFEAYPEDVVEDDKEIDKGNI